MRACALLAVYNIGVKKRSSSVALVYVEMGLGLGMGQNVLAGDPPARLSPQSWIDYRKAWRTLSCCKGWLTATLGYSSSLDDDWTAGKPVASGYTPPSSEADAAWRSAAADITRTKTTQLAIIKAKLLSRTAFAFADISKADVDGVRADLRRWHDQLDPSMRLAQLLSSSSSSSAQRPTTAVVDPTFRRGVCLLHCLHLGAMMLLQRRILQEYAPAARGDRALANETVRDLCDAIEEGFGAATASARVLGLVHADDGVLPRCWLCVFQSYIATTEILFMVAQRLLHRFPGSQCRPDLASASQSLAVLRFCAAAAADHRGVAGQFLRSVQSHYDYLNAVTRQDDAEESSIEQMYCFSPPREEEEEEEEEETFQMAHHHLTWETLLKVPPGESRLHEVSRHLMAQICSPPFAANIDKATTTTTTIDRNDGGFKGGGGGPVVSPDIPMPLSGAEEAVFGPHLDWSAAETTGLLLCGGSIIAAAADDHPVESMGSVNLSNGSLSSAARTSPADGLSFGRGT